MINGWLLASYLLVFDQEIESEVEIVLEAKKSHIALSLSFTSDDRILRYPHRIIYKAWDGVCGFKLLVCLDVNYLPA